MMKIAVSLAIVTITYALSIIINWTSFDISSLMMMTIALVGILVACLNAMASIISRLRGARVARLRRYFYIAALLTLFVIFIIAGGSSCLALAKVIEENTNEVESETDTVPIVTTPMQEFLPPTAMPSTPTPTLASIWEDLQPTIKPVSNYCDDMIVKPCLHVVQEGETLVSITNFRYGVQWPESLDVAEEICEENLEFLEQQFDKKVHPDEKKENWHNNPCNFLQPGNILVLPDLSEATN